MFKKAQGVQKKAREDVKRGKESAKEPGIRDRIKALNNNAEPDQLRPRLTQLSKGKKMNTYEVSKANRKTQTKRNDGMGIYGFGSDDIFGFRSEDELMPDDDLDSTSPLRRLVVVALAKKRVQVGWRGVARGESREMQGRRNR